MTFLRPHYRTSTAIPCLAVAALLAACASRQPPVTAATQAGPPSPRWTQDTLIEPDQLLPNGLRPLRYFYW